LACCVPIKGVHVFMVKVCTVLGVSGLIALDSVTLVLFLADLSRTTTTQNCYGNVFIRRAFVIVDFSPPQPMLFFFLCFHISLIRPT